MRLKDKTVIITGGGAGIGKAAATIFAHEGARVVIAEFNGDNAEAVARAIRADGGEAIAVQTDVGSEDSMAAMVERAVSTFGGINGLYNNVGGSRTSDGKITEISNDEFWTKMRIDVFGTWLGCQLTIPHMIAAGGGAIVNTSSIHGVIGVRGRNAYATAKGAVISMTRALAVEFADRKIRVNCIAPGGTLTERVVERMKTSGASGGSDDHLLGYSDPADIAYAALYLLSDEARTTTGQVLSVDSGWSIS